jgi:predicted DCC family thiol-disulfide oxidoreductase YuxK
MSSASGSQGAAEAERQPWVFYDGSCGLCHRSVRSVLASPRAREEFRFAPLGGAAFAREIADPVQAERASRANSIVVLTAGGEILTRSAAAIHLAGRMGRGYRILAALGRLVPAWILDLGYDGVAAVRHRLFAPPDSACPDVPLEWRGRIED